MKPTNLNPFFIDQIVNFAHLITQAQQTKEEFLNTVKGTYSLSNPKTSLFFQSIERSVFDTIGLSRDRQSILFNQ
jgi:hypothetical protein